MTKDVFKKGMVMMTVAFPNMQIAIEAFYELLADLTDAEYQSAVLKIVRGEKELYPNTNVIALIRRKALESAYPTSGEAWAMANDWAANYTKIHPLVMQAAKQIGRWELTHAENLSTTRAHFIKFYEDLIRQEAGKFGEKTALDFNQAKQIPEAK